jgi:anti-sigma regulatory factor (Ser/Thr protein kinase)
MTGDQITLTIPRDEPFREVAHLVLGGVAARLNLTFEHIDDLETALDAALELAPKEGEVTVKLTIDEEAICASVGPLPADSVRAELEREGEGMTLRRILDTVVDSYEFDGDGWLELRKQLTEVAA